MRLRGLLALLAGAVMMTFSSVPVGAGTNETGITFSNENPAPTLGHGDIEYNVRDTTNHVDWSTYSYVNQGTLCGTGGSPCNVDVVNLLGKTTSSSPLTIAPQIQLNSAWRETDPASGNYWDWIHETSTAAFVPGGLTGGPANPTWWFFWDTYPTAGQSTATSCTPAGGSFPAYGWIGYEVVNNASGYTTPQPPAQSSFPKSIDASHVPGYETMGWVGNAWKYNTDSSFKNQIDTMTPNFATGASTAGRPPDGYDAAHDPYIAWSEPSVMYVGGAVPTLLLSMTGYKPVSDDKAVGCQTFSGDDWLFVYTFSTNSWAGCKIFDSTAAANYNYLVSQANYKYFTGATIFQDPNNPSNIDYLVSPMNRIYQGTNPVVPKENYNGLMLFGLNFNGGCPTTSALAGSVMPNSAAPFNESASTFMGAGSLVWPEFDFNSSAIIWQMHRYCLNPIAVKAAAWVSGTDTSICPNG